MVEEKIVMEEASRGSHFKEEVNEEKVTSIAEPSKGISLVA